MAVIVVGARDLVSRVSRRYGRVSWFLSFGVVLFAGAIAAIYGAGWLDLDVGGYLLMVSLLVLAVVRPAWLVLALVAIPPGFWSGSITGLTILLAFALVVHVARSGNVSFGLTSGLLPIVLLLILGHLFRADVGDAASLARDNFAKYMGYYVTVGLLSFSLARTGLLTVRQFVPALLVGVGGAALALLVVGGPSSLSSRSSLDVWPGSAVQAQFGYVSAMAFIVSFAWAASGDEGSGEERPIRWMIAAFFGVTTALSFTRGAWLTALIGIFFVARRTGKFRYLWLVAVAAALLLLVPVAHERLLGDVRGGVSESFATGEAGTGRWGLWGRLFEEARTEPVFGHGSGFAFTLDSQELFGFEGEFVAHQDVFVYTHDDLMYWMLDLGLIGVGLYLAFWLALRAKYKQLIVHPDARVRRDALLLGGAFTTLLIAGLVASGIFIRPIADRAFVAAGILFGLADRHRIGDGS